MIRLAAALAILFCVPARADERGLASTYRDSGVSCPGERYSAKALIAAHRTLPCGTRVKITNLANGISAILRIVDRGPCADPPSALCKRLGLARIRKRIIDVSPAGQHAIRSNGLARVSLEIQK